jgi:hypothetical protein
MRRSVPIEDSANATSEAMASVKDALSERSEPVPPARLGLRA